LPVLFLYGCNFYADDFAIPGKLPENSAGQFGLARIRSG
jgi:hypothetical protein